MSFDLGSLLQQYIGAAQGNNQGANEITHQDAHDHFDQVAQNAPTDLLSQGIQAAFNSNQTPPFGQMVGQLFGQGNAQQQGGMVNQLLATMGPALLAGLLAKSASGASGGLSGLAGLLGGTSNAVSGAVPALSAQDVAKLTPLQIQEIATHAEQNDPGVVQKMSNFYAEHPTLVKTLGGFAVTLALSKMADHVKGD
jgi:hypothetical protein